MMIWNAMRFFKDDLHNYQGTPHEWMPLCMNSSTPTWSPCCPDSKSPWSRGDCCAMWNGFSKNEHDQKQCPSCSCSCWP